MAQLDRLGADTAEMRRTLIEERGSLALSLVDTDIASVLYAEATKKFKDWLATQGIGTLLSVFLFIAILIAARWLARVARRVTCLLYTSPSPRDKRQSRMPSSA